jgi:NAD(P)-dependent dehydrogenase (short-subunit alcohol dehydrogenase family)
MATLMGKKVVVVGGSSGIGLGVAAFALQKGAELVIVGRSRQKLEAAERTLSEAGRRIARFAADMTDEVEIARLFDEVGAFDHLVSTAGTAPPGDPIQQTDIEVVRRFVDSKLLGAVLVAKHAARFLNPGGSMTFTSGINKDRPPVPGGAVVSAIAGSFSYFARALSLELAPTRELAGQAKLDLFKGLAARLPAGKIATPADIASAYVFAMESDFTTGQTLHVDGGQSLI